MGESEFQEKQVLENQNSPTQESMQYCVNWDVLLLNPICADHLFSIFSLCQTN